MPWASHNDDTAVSTEPSTSSWPLCTICTLALCSALLLCPHPAQATVGDALSNVLRGVAPDWVVIVALAAAPLIELRGAIPVGIAVLHLNPLVVLTLAFIGNMLPVPLIMAALGPLSQAFERFPRLHNFVQKALVRAQNQAAEWGTGNAFWGLAMFVGVPLPGTGAWSGAAVAFVLGMPYVTGILANAIGVLIAGTLVTVLSCMGWAGFWTAVVTLMTIPIVSWLVRSMSQDPKSPAPPAR